MCESLHGLTDQTDVLPQAGETGQALRIYLQDLVQRVGQEENKAATLIEGYLKMVDTYQSYPADLAQTPIVQLVSEECLPLFQAAINVFMGIDERIISEGRKETLDETRAKVTAYQAVSLIFKREVQIEKVDAAEEALLATEALMDKLEKKLEESLEKSGQGPAIEQAVVQAEANLLGTK